MSREPGQKRQSHTLLDFYDVVVVGSGPAGLMAAHHVAYLAKKSSNPVSVCLIDSQKQFGKKLLLSGGGRSNYLRMMPKEELIEHFPGSGKFLNSCFSYADPSFLLDYISAWGVKPSFEGSKQDRVYSSSKARGLRDKACDALSQLSVSLHPSYELIDFEIPEQRAKDITGADTSPLIKLRLLDKEKEIERINCADKFISLSCRALVLACGGASVPSSGSNGAILRLLKRKGLTCFDFCSALSGLQISTHLFGQLSGLSLDEVELKIFPLEEALQVPSQAQPQEQPQASTKDGLRDDYGKKLKVQVSRGALIFRHKGLGAQAAMDISRWISRYPYEELHINFAPQFCSAKKPDKSLRDEELLAQADSLLKKNPKLRLSQIYKTELPDRLRAVLLSSLSFSIKADDHLADLTKQQRLELIAAFHRFKTQLTGFDRLEKAVLSTGGLSLRELSSKSFELKAFPSVYAVGELVDIDGNCGGYNFTYAWASGALAARSIINKLSH